jgi:DNA-binding NarL/FixJ family response regulator
MEIRVAVFEDNKLVREALVAILNGTRGLTCCGAFQDANRWDMEIGRCQPDVVLMDIEMPGMNGIEATRKIGEKYPEVCILIQTVFHDNDKVFQALCAGASGYLLKNDPPAKLIEGI